MDYTKVKIILLVTFFQLCLPMLRVDGKTIPHYTPNKDEEANQCAMNDDILRLCQRCATETKSNFVMPMCCYDKEEVQDYCQRYLRFGI